MEKLGVEGIGTLYLSPLRMEYFLYYVQFSSRLKDRINIHKPFTISDEQRFCKHLTKSAGEHVTNSSKISS